mmetsp:Transcript_41557/g.88115  ORF Transcript_41557/g.88115 Transcript_41557/m.88115 type:complete len:334 (+) Transcript_41557:83-1084(+)|eukprot:CAMPEP_0204339764 /NCGR_PEP_ID=MMETSP0469-20131031/22043_1 /ASSEMBLY_ACC=CAM_ASM_000384 /TAXON_ID=2969 /ORGANISM="Oxyrrhis marina" /LENGTH=333 /DNA_ID=CAMNT_0051324153 /DNA_START=44 /DNA_END=1045 /DNA_ORIENTATION=-
MRLAACFLHSTLVLAASFLGFGEDKLQVYLDKVAKDNSAVDCQQVCEAEGQGYKGFRQQQVGDVRDWECVCKEKIVRVQCVGTPKQKCCRDSCPGGTCPTQPAGFHCPAALPSAAEAKAWLAAVNVFRCMHDVPAMAWSDPMAENTKAEFGSKSGKQPLQHSRSYDLDPPAGPSGENLYRFLGPGSDEPNEYDAIAAWYQTVKQCGEFPGCYKGRKGDFSNFAVLAWNGGQELGCAHGKDTLMACRFKGPDFKSCNTPAYGSPDQFPQHYDRNVYERVRTLKECRALIEECGLPLQNRTYEGISDCDGLVTRGASRECVPGKKSKLDKNLNPK